MIERDEELAEGVNLDPKTVRGFGEEWSLFDHTEKHDAEMERIWGAYFRIFPWQLTSKDSIGIDVGCGSGRWARIVAPMVGLLHCVDASVDALKVASTNLAAFDNCRMHLASVDRLPFADGSCDFAYSLGVLHHVPDTAAGIKAVAAKLKPNAPFLLYLYYAMENRPRWYRVVWRVSDVIRRLVARQNFTFRRMVAAVMAITVYWPLARCSRVLESAGVDVDRIPLSAYRSRSFYVMRTDALDRFGTRLEKRFTRDEIREMLVEAGFVDIQFSDQRPFWLCVGRKA